MPSVRINDAEVLVIGVLKGLVTEEDKVAKAFHDFRPDAIAISASKEELAALRAKEVHADYSYPPWKVYKIYRSISARSAAHACYLKAIELADAASIPLLPIDRHWVHRPLQAHPPSGHGESRSHGRSSGASTVGSAEEFALDWDRKVNRSKGFRQLERDREEHMARTLRNMSSKHHRILALVEYERSAGVERCLQAQ
jgi:hypothetical protein